MQAHERKALSQARLEHAVECLSAARNLLETGNYKSAANRSYYAVFHAMRAVLAFDEIDMKRTAALFPSFVVGISKRKFLKQECRRLSPSCLTFGRTAATTISL